jgi:hypothetical protein
MRDMSYEELNILRRRAEAFFSEMLKDCWKREKQI